MLEVGPKCSTSHSDTQTNFATHVCQIQTKNSKLTRGHANSQCLQLIAQHVSPLWFFSALYKNLWLQMVLIKIFTVLSHQRCLIPCVFFLGIWTWRGRFTSRQPLTATLADRSFLGKCPKSLSCKYSTSLSWSPPGCWTRLLFMDYNFQLQCNWLNTFLTEIQNKTKQLKPQLGRDKSAFKMWEGSYTCEQL